ncbi:MAG TPA: DsbC family protein [Pseudomonadales bacterium]|nr:DsbC family protein [Pseudomonadales bacterium]
MKMSLVRAGMLMSVLAMGVAHAAEPSANSAEAAIREHIAKSVPGASIKEVSPTPAGLFQVVLDSGELLYATADGKYLVAGSLFELSDKGQPTNLTENWRAKKRVEQLAAVKREDTVNFSPAGTPKASIFVFTDTDCGYCKKFHNEELSKLNAQGVEVRYLAWPGVGGEHAKKQLAAVWCSADRKAALTSAKNRQELPPAPANCHAPVMEQWKMGAEMGVRGTPAIFAADGHQLGGGFLTADQVMEELGLAAK